MNDTKGDQEHPLRRVHLVFELMLGKYGLIGAGDLRLSAGNIHTVEYVTGSAGEMECGRGVFGLKQLANVVRPAFLYLGACKNGLKNQANFTRLALPLFVRKIDSPWAGLYNLHLHLDLHLHLHLHLQLTASPQVRHCSILFLTTG